MCCSSSQMQFPALNMSDAAYVDVQYSCNGGPYFDQFVLRHDEVVSQSGFGSPVQTNDQMRALDYNVLVPDRFSYESVSNSQQQCDAVPCATASKPSKGARKRERDKNWTDEETAVLVECKRAAFYDSGSLFRKSKSKATNWDAISQELKNNSVTRASGKTGDQCRLRWDTLVKSHRKIKENCAQNSKGFAELTEEEMSELKLATLLDKEWYEVIDTISCKGRSQKHGKQSPGVGDYANLESRMTTDYESNQLLIEGTPAESARKSPPNSLQTGDPPGRPERRKSSRKQIAIPGFSSMAEHLRNTLLDLILGAGFFEGRYWYSDIEDDKALSLSCRWLSIVQNRSCARIYDDVNELVKMKLVHISVTSGPVFIDQSRFRIFDKYVKKVIFHNPVYNTHLRMRDQTISSWRTFGSGMAQIRVLKLEECTGLETANLKALRTLRSMYISNCTKLVEVTGWKFLRELGWLEIAGCPSYGAYPDLPDLPSLREFLFDRQGIRECPPRHGLDVGHCARLRRLEIWHDKSLKDFGDLSELKCLETLIFEDCRAISTISDLRELHLLIVLKLRFCSALTSLPYLGHMKELEDIDLTWSNIEEIPGIEKLLSLKSLDCSYTELKRLPDLHHLPVLQMVWLEDTPLTKDDPSSFYFDKERVSYNTSTKSVYVDVSDVSDEECDLSNDDASFSDGGLN